MSEGLQYLKAELIKRKAQMWGLAFMSWLKRQFPGQGCARSQPPGARRGPVIRGVWRSSLGSRAWKEIPDQDWVAPLLGVET